MAEESVGQLADTIGTPIDRLLLQIEEAGLSQRSADDVINEADKESLLAFLKRSHGEEEGAPKKITLKRRTLSTLKTGGSAGRGRTVNVEVRKKRTYVRRGAVEPEQAAADAAKAETPETVARRPVVSEADADAERKRQEAAAQRLAEQQEKERRAKEEEEERKRQAEEEAAKAEAEAAAKAASKQEEALEDKVSTRKDKRDRHDLDEDDKQQKKKSHAAVSVE